MDQEVKKPWYLSKSIWSSIVIVAVGTVQLIDSQFGTNIMSSSAATFIMTVLGLFGIYSRASATQRIG